MLISFQGTPFSTGMFRFSSTVWKFEEKNLIFGEGKIFVFTSNTVGKYWKMIETVDAIFLFRFINYLSGRRLNVHIRDIYVKKRCDVIRRIFLNIFRNNNMSPVRM